jgi:hypothetical protein
MQSHKWGSGAHGQWQALYSPVKACSVRRQIAVQKIGQGAAPTPFINSGGSSDGGW